MTWRGYMITSAVLGLVVGALFAGSPLVTSVPVFCVLFAVVAMTRWVWERAR